MKNSISKLRPGVTAVFKDVKSGLLLACERTDLRNTWQFPQGGIEEGEIPKDTLYREMLEEIGTDKFKILKEAPNFISYLFPSALKSKITKKYAGQTQKWFLVEFEAGISPDLTKADGEFINWKWESISAILEQIVDWKKQSYIDGFCALGLQKE